MKRGEEKCGTTTKVVDLMKLATRAKEGERKRPHRRQGKPPCGRRMGGIHSGKKGFVQEVTGFVGDSPQV